MPAASPSLGRVSLAGLATRAPLVAAATAAVNAAVWRVGAALGRMTIGVGEVVIASLVGVALGALALVALGKTVRRIRRTFVTAGIVVLVLYALGPISAALAPYREGAETFNVATVLATEVMHLVSGLAILAVFTRPPVLDEPTTPDR